MKAGTLEITITHLDFEPDIACEGPRAGQPCPDPAAWLGALNCCGAERYGCNWHRDLMNEMAVVPGVVCGTCRVPFSVRWMPISV
jgi:hypothetical protein